MTRPLRSFVHVLEHEQNINESRQQKEYGGKERIVLASLYLLEAFIGLAGFGSDELLNLGVMEFLFLFTFSELIGNDSFTELSSLLGLDLCAHFVSYWKGTRFGHQARY